MSSGDKANQDLTTNVSEGVTRLSQENTDLKKQVKALTMKLNSYIKDGGIGAEQSSTREFSKSDISQLNEKVNAMQNENDELKMTVQSLNDQLKTVQRHQKSTMSLAVEVEDLKEKHDEVLQRVRLMKRKTGSIDDMEEQLEMLTSWKKKKEKDDKKSENSDDDDDPLNFMSTMKALDKMNDGGNKSSFCVRLQPRQALQNGESIKLTEIASALVSGLLNQETGSIKPNGDCTINIGWKMHQEGDGEIRYYFEIDGLQEKVYLGSTKNAEDVCSGTLVLPLKRDQQVWVEAKRIRGPNASIASCNIMGWQLEKTLSYGPSEILRFKQKNLLGSGKVESSASMLDPAQLLGMFLNN